MEKSGFYLPTHIVSGAGIVINDNNEILLMKHPRRGWELPGGIVENDENLVDAIQREIFEETGIKVKVEKLFCISSNTSSYPGYNGVEEIPTKLILDFICKVEFGEPVASSESEETRFFHKNQVLDLIQSESMKERFSAYLEASEKTTFLEFKIKPFELKLKTKI